MLESPHWSYQYGGSLLLLDMPRIRKIKFHGGLVHALRSFQLIENKFDPKPPPSLVASSHTLEPNLAGSMRIDRSPGDRIDFCIEKERK